VRQPGIALLGLFFANVAANLIALLPLVGNLGASVGNVVAIGLGFWLVRRWSRTEMEGVTLLSSARALGATCLVAAPVGGCIGATAVAHTTGAPWNDVFATWMLGDISGYSLIIVPGLALQRSDIVAFAKPKVLAEVLGQTIVLLLTIILGWQVVRFPFVIIAAPATWIAVRNGLVRGSIVGFLTTAILILTYRAHLWQLPIAFGGVGASALWLPAVAFMLFSVQVGLVADEFRAQATRTCWSRRLPGLPS
jgi:hypothetical protein